MKKRGYGEGNWNGFGGKIKKDEDIASAAKRELYEEANIKADKITKVGIIEFEFKGDPTIRQVHFFKIDNFSGDIKESEEMRPKWFPLEKIPYENMWPDDKYWLPMLLEGKKFKGKFFFDKGNIYKMMLGEVSGL